MNKKIEKLMNDQLNLEYFSSSNYLAISGYAYSIGLKGLSKFFFNQHKSEIEQARKIYNFINYSGGRIKIEGFENPKNNYANISNAIKLILAQEKETTVKVNELTSEAISENDFATSSFLTFLIQNQVDLENELQDMIKKLELIGENGLGIIQYDMELDKLINNT